MEYRGWITVPGVDIEGDDAERLLTALVDYHDALGPVLSGAGGGDVAVIVATDADDDAAAAAVLYDAVADGLRRAGLARHYPTAIELEPVTEALD